jgi:TRAP-type C4-dicarboxylate transport system permease small subunit
MPWMTKGAVYSAIPIAGLFVLLFSIENLILIIRTPADQIGAQTQSEG